VSTVDSLGLRALLKTAVTRSGMDSSARAVTGLVPAAQALFVAAAANAQNDGTVLHIVRPTLISSSASPTSVSSSPRSKDCRA